jgi:glycosyltransferase involved in cell wall biosynthesis
MTPPGVSIAMATYNGADYVEEQLESFAAQTRLPDDLVVCDDGSSDGTLALLEHFAARAPFPVRVEANPQRLFTTANFERALSLCSGEIIFLADQDDVWMSQKIERLTDFLSKHAEVGAVFSNGEVVDAQLRPMQHELWDGLWFGAKEQALVRAGRELEVFLKHVVAAGTTLAFRGCYRDLYLPLPQLRHCHDAWIAFLIAAVSSCAIVEESLIQYRVHGSNQFGLARPTLREQLAKAKEQLEIGAFAYAIGFFEAARQRLEAGVDCRGFEVSARTFELIEAKIAHARSRDRMRSSLLARLPAIVGETLSGRYFRYSYGAKSIAQDLFLR